MAYATLCGLHVLDFLSSCPSAASSREISTATGMTRATTYRTLDELEREGWVTGDGFPRRYQLSWKAAGIGLRALGHNRVRDIAVRSVIDLARETSATAFLSFTDGLETLFTDTVEVVGGRVMLGTICSRLPLLATASGRSALAAMVPFRAEPIVRAGLPLLAGYAAITEARVLEEVERARLQGYAVTDCEVEPDLVSLASSVLDAGANPVAAVGVSFHGTRPRAELEARYGEAVHQWARRASIELGYRAARPVG